MNILKRFFGGGGIVSPDSDLLFHNNYWEKYMNSYSTPILSIEASGSYCGEYSEYINHQNDMMKPDTILRCTYCGSKTLENDRICSQCGAPL